MRGSLASWRWLVTALLVFVAPATAIAVECGPGTLGTYYWNATGQITKANNCSGSSGFRCYAVENPGTSVQKTSSSCDPLTTSCAVDIHVTATIPGLRDMIVEDGLFSSLTPWAEWYPCAGAGCTKDFTCGLDAFGGRINRDDLDTWLSTGLTCAAARTLNLSVKIRVCAASSCELSKIVDIGAVPLSAGMGCPLPPMYAGPEGCDNGGGGGGSGTGGGGGVGGSGASGPACPLTSPAGGGGSGCSVSGEGSPSCAPAWAGNAQLRYAAGGVGTTGLAGASAWKTTLGLFWSHDYAERIVIDTDTTSPGHVWLLTKHGVFREFSNLASGSGLRLYQQRAPSDEFRQLYYDTSTGEWQLKSLNGRTDYYRSDGQWKKTVTAQDPDHPTEGTYNSSGQLTAVSFPDGHGDSFTYQTNGKLSTITTQPVSGSGTSSRTWTLTWSGDELTEVARPDGRSWVFTYDSSRPGYLTRVSLVSGSSSRVTAAFSYLSGTNRVEHTWRGDTSFTGSNAVDKVTYDYTNPTLPTAVEITRTVSGTFGEVTTYTLGRDTRSAKPKVTSIERSCPTCSQTSTTTLAFAGSNPLLTSSVTDPKGTRTDFTYDSNGRVLTKTEAANVSALTRLTSYTYDSNFPGLVTRIEVPSTSGGSNKRRTDFAYDSTTGVLETVTIDGYEAGSSLPSGYKVTAYTANDSGEFTAIDPPGYSTNDQTTFTYDLTGRNGHVPDSRTDPLAGTTTFGYDGFNRRTSVIDPNGVETLTTYDVLDRVTEVLRTGESSPTGDLVTQHFFNAFGDLFCTKLPRGNGVEYGYDSAGRLTTVIRGTVVSSPSSTSCIDTGESRERTVYQLDGAGHRVDESREKWTGSAWSSAYHTTHVYTCQLDKTTLGAGGSTPSVSEFCYDPNGNLEKTWDANHPKGTYSNPTLLYAYDALNRLTSVTQGPSTSGAATTQYTYDVQGHLASVTDAESNQTTYTTSDRDLLRQQVSPASGTTTYTYDEHRQQLTATDARSIVAERTLDAAGRVTAEVFDDGSPYEMSATYTYGSTPAQYDVGKLIGVETNRGISTTIGYDRFGRVISDSGVGYGYDDNSNRNRIDYPYHGSAVYTYDYADRQATLAFPDEKTPLVSDVTYAPGGPLTGLTLANGLVETRSFDTRYFPTNITAGSLLDWDFTLDGMSNPTEIDGTLDGTSSTATYSYQDYLYSLSGASGPWGSRTWTYDKIGNRLTSSGTSLPSWSYTYSASGHGPRLESVAESATSTTWDFDHDAAGNQTAITETIGTTDQWTTTYTMGTDGRISYLSSGEIYDFYATEVLYDGRGRLAKAARVGNPWFTIIPDNESATYSPEGQLLSLSTEVGDIGESMIVADSFLYFAGRPVYRRTDRDMNSESEHYITTDHLGTPVLSTDAGGDVLASDWTDPFRPHTGEILQYPGQWTDTALPIGGGGPPSDRIDQLQYNVNRWYSPQTGRYSQPDPLGLRDGPNPYPYAWSRPTSFVDPLGLRVQVCCRALETTSSLVNAFVGQFRHCFIRQRDGENGYLLTLGLHTLQTPLNWFFAAMPTGALGWTVPGHSFDTADPNSPDLDCGPWAEDRCGAVDQCAVDAYSQYPPESRYFVPFGPNSNTFASYVATKCNLPIPESAGMITAPGWWSRDHWGG